MDRVGIAIVGTPRLYEPVFAEGWGNLDILTTLGTPKSTHPSTVLALEAKVISETSTRRVTDLRFPSPAEGLPTSATTGHARLIEPRHAHRLAVGFASFNEHGYGTRTSMVAPLLEAGTAVALLENPYYGQRRPDPDRQPMRTVSDLLVMGSAAVWEGKSLASYFASMGSWSIGYFGYSMGGNIAALAAATNPFPVACAALAASHSPGPVFTEGALSKAIAWEALGGRSELPRLVDTLGAASVLNFEPLPWTRAAVIVAAERDGYIPEHAIREPASALARFGNAGVPRRPCLRSEVPKACPGGSDRRCLRSLRNSAMTDPIRAPRSGSADLPLSIPRDRRRSGSTRPRLGSGDPKFDSRCRPAP